MLKRGYITVLSVVTLSSLCLDTFAQSNLNMVKRNRIELYFPVCHFFDGSKTNWSILVPALKRVYGAGHQYLYTKTVKRPPFTFGIDWTRYINIKSGYKISLQTYWMSYYDQERNYKPGDVLHRKFHEFSAAYLHKMEAGKKFRIDAAAGINYRYGVESVHIRFYGWENVQDGLRNSDIGLLTGLRMERSLPLNLVLSGEAKYCRYIYRYDKGVILSFVPDLKKRGSPDVLTIKVGIGYRFGVKKKSIQ